MRFPNQAWDFIEGFSCIAPWTTIEWQAFEAMTWKMQEYGLAGGLNQEVIDLVDNIPTFPNLWGTCLIYPGEAGNTCFLPIPYNFYQSQLTDALAEFGVSSSEIPSLHNMTLQKITADGKWGQLLGCNLVNKNRDRVVMLDRSTFFYPYLGPSNFAHELGHAFVESNEEDFPRQCEEAVLLGALQVEPTENHEFIKVLLDQLRFRMGKI